MKTFLRLLLIAISSTLLLTACSSDDDNPTINNPDAPMRCTISGEYDINLEADMVHYASFPEDDGMLRVINGYMDHEGKSHVLTITLNDTNADFKKDYDIDQDMSEGAIIFLYDLGDGITPESYNMNISGKINFTTLTDTKAIGTFNCVAKSLDGSKQITITNGVINKK